MAALNDYPLLLLFVVVPVLFALAEIGFRVARRRAKSDDKVHEQAAATRDQAGVLLSLMLGFTLAMSLSRYDLRKELIVQEANAIGTARLRADVLPEPLRARALPLFRAYVSSRIELTHAGLDAAALERARRKSADVQGQLWAIATEGAAASPTPITALFVQAINETIDVDERRVAALENRIPREIWIMVAVLAMLTSLLSGSSLRSRSFSAMFLPALMFAFVALVIADLDTPGRGLIQMDQQSIERLAAP